jgi:hypothetical protein
MCPAQSASEPAGCLPWVKLARGATVVRGHDPDMLSVMERSRTALERAFALAKSGACTSVDDVKRCLRLEGYQVSQIVGSTLARQLRTLIAEARGLPIPRTPQGQKRRADAIGGNARPESPNRTRRSEIARNAAAKSGSKTP